MDSSFRTTRGYFINEKEEIDVTYAMEDYLEMIYRLCANTGYTRVGKLSESLNVKPSSASKMVGKLILLRLIENDENGCIILTEKGKILASQLLNRHEVIEKFLSFIGNQDPLRETELVEHFFSGETVERIEKLLSFFENNPECRKRFGDYIGQM